MTFDCSILENSSRKGLYRRIVFSAPEIAAKAAPGQFVHIRIPGLRDRILRRPFSICGYDPITGNVTVVYKVVGAGTAELAEMLPGQACNIMGPLGKGYPMPSGEETPILVAGGYGSAAMLPLAERSANKGILLLGARSAADLILAEEYEAAGYEVRLATQDGSAGQKGLVRMRSDSDADGARTNRRRKQLEMLSESRRTHVLRNRRMFRLCRQNEGSLLARRMALLAYLQGRTGLLRRRGVL